MCFNFQIHGEKSRGQRLQTATFEDCSFVVAALGPILPFLNVFGKQLGVSEMVMGSITAILPILFLIAKPLFGLVVDYFQEQRKRVFMGLVFAMSACYVLLYFIPQPSGPFITDKASYHLPGIGCNSVDFCQNWVRHIYLIERKS
jgi:hypothetical protein